MHGTIKRNQWAIFGTEEKIAAIIAAYDNQNNTAGAIAAKLSALLDCDIPRNSIIGLYHRHRAKPTNTLQDYPLNGHNPNLGGSLRNLGKSSPKVAKAPTVKKVRHKTTVHVKPPTGPETIPEMRVSAAPEPFLKMLLDMNSTDCRWPVADSGAETKFCCHEVAPGSAYCGFHYSLSRGRGTPSERAAHVVGKKEMA